MNGSPYARLGLSRNPFTADPAPGVASELWVNRPAPEPPRAGQRRLVQLLGEKGAGKTSLLLRWRDEEAGPYRYVPPTFPLRDGWRRALLLPVRPLVYWDEADRAPAPLLRFALHRAARTGATVVVGTHHDLTPEATRAELPVQTHAFPPLTPDALRAWCKPRIAAAALPDQPATALPVVPDDILRETCDAAGSSLREASVILHLWAARLARGSAPDSS
ncbi:MAG: hypothetical protein AAF907_02280 [Planctomycetota bacterium]